MLRQSRVMVVDDDADTLSLLREVVAKEGYQVETAEDAETALQKFGEWQPDLVITDIHMPGKDGLALLAAVREKAPDILVILLTAYGSLKTAVDAIKAGAFDYLSKPFVVDDIRLVVRRALEHKKLVRENRSLRDQLRERYRFDNLVGSSAGMVAVYKLIARVAETDSTVLIQGESGTGKEMIARAIHANSTRSNGPFVAIDTGSLAETLLESELGMNEAHLPGPSQARRDCWNKHILAPVSWTKSRTFLRLCKASCFAHFRSVRSGGSGARRLVELTSESLPHRKKT